ncbi:MULTISPECIES: hypothetical protein [unclassified Variovorax]|uniref:hypothetical protein n=1 Tax=unclassified Variovorax TaxID=663243 RepID=UPI001BD2DC63|nr:MULTISPECIES: hypothetical protein [unclassified Variovorax]
MAAAPPCALLTAEFIAMVNRGVSTVVASRDAALRPSLMRAMGSSISMDGTRITVFLARSQGRQLLLDVASTGQIAVVFSDPGSHRTLQVKAGAVELRNADAGDTALLRRYLLAMEREISAIGYPTSVVDAMLACRLEDLVAISFSPAAAFDQTPGPRAGSALPATN